MGEVWVLIIFGWLDGWFGFGLSCLFFSISQLLGQINVFKPSTA